MKLFASALALLPAVLVMAEEPINLSATPISAQHSKSVCDGVVARLAIFGVKADAKVCLDNTVVKLIPHISGVPSKMTCIEAVAAANILGIKADAKVCLASAGHGKKSKTTSVSAKHAKSACNGVVARLAAFGIKVDAKVCLNDVIIKLIPLISGVPSKMTCVEACAAANILGIKADAKVCLALGGNGKKHIKRDGEVSVMHDKPSKPPKTPAEPEKPCKPGRPGKPGKPSKPPVQPPAYPPTTPEKPCKSCQPPNPPSYPPAPEKPCKSCQPPTYPPTTGKPRYPKSCETIIAKIHTLCGAKIDLGVCLRLGVDIDLLRLERLKCRVVVGAAQLVGVSVNPSVCNLLDGKIRVGYNRHGGYTGGHSGRYDGGHNGGYNGRRNGEYNSGGY
ncbi:hypothetical protein K493DRAFT_302387 [Basidiobolus meristosporus CBS 931.73]|uniref:Hydrophobin n=1 Tax=Basidiobolus meristosporus CBS 931.73 TaxID=1314790 RepID=A0A1Y1Y7J7_9FUNG|nr:hypothetical protein K493DRAFT_302387 [Basidiobolus meristosporus CBS 931.73]|eukprot:ORX93875.1 hypothetical protein K493DRAFT_302387 [Basidiobolus meristosporus CBS 931.73]